MRHFTEDFADSWTYKLPYEAVGIKITSEYAVIRAQPAL